VNRVGVDLNSASVDLLKYVSGIGDKLAENTVGYRDSHGLFNSRTQLREIEGFGEKTFEQAAGFLRIKESEHPLDRTAVHPESYPLVDGMANSLGISVKELMENPGQINAIDYKHFEAEAGRYTISDIREELLKPGRDPRDKFVVPKFRDDVKDIADLNEGMELEGTVTNVTNFGAFVDLGVHQDGLVHISELSHKYVQDARQAVKVGDIVKVKVIGVDSGMKRISLSMKAVIPKPPRRPRRKRVKVAQPAPPAPANVAAKPEFPKPVPAPQMKRDRPERPARKEPKPLQQPRPAKPAVEAVPPPPKQTMEEKIRLLQEKFGRAR
jgi:protein Tex